jgi:hypothetical protein
MIRYVFQPLRQARCNVTIFVQTYRCPTVAQYDLLYRRTNLTVVITTLETPPSIDRQCAKRLAPRLRSLKMAIPLLDYTQEFLGRLYNRWRCDLRRREYEAAHVVRFQWIVWLRPDVVYLDPLLIDHPIHTSKTDSVAIPVWQPWGGRNDRFAIVPRSLASQYFGMFPFLCSFDPARISHGVLNPESLYAWYLDTHDLTVKPLYSFRFLRLRMAVFHLLSNATCPFPSQDLTEFPDALPKAYGEICAAAVASAVSRRSGDRAACLATLDRVCGPRTPAS